MSDSKDSKQLDRSVSLPKYRLSIVYHTNLTNVEMKALQSNVRNQREVKDNDKVKNNDFDIETEDEDSSKRKTIPENVTRVSQDTKNGVFDVETEDESSKCKKTWITLVQKIRMKIRGIMKIWKIPIRKGRRIYLTQKI